MVFKKKYQNTTSINICPSSIYYLIRTNIHTYNKYTISKFQNIIDFHVIKYMTLGY